MNLKGFWWISGVTLRPKMEPKSMKKRCWKNCLKIMTTKMAKHRIGWISLALRVFAHQSFNLISNLFSYLLFVLSSLVFSVFSCPIAASSVLPVRAMSSRCSCSTQILWSSVASCLGLSCSRPLSWAPCLFWAYLIRSDLFYLALRCLPGSARSDLQPSSHALLSLV